MLDIRNLSMRFGDTPVIERLNLVVGPAQFVAVLGPSGCGKTTLLRIAAGVLSPSAGFAANRFRRTAMVFQDARLAGWMTAVQNAAFGLKAAGVSKPERERQVRQILLRLGLEDEDLSKRPHSLSGGMRQRVGIARALVVRPDLLLLDEPFSSLDIGLRREMQGLVRKEVTDMGIAALLVTHDLAEAVRVADRIIVLSARPSAVVAEFDNEPCNDDAEIFETAARLLRRGEIAEALLRRGSRHRTETEKPDAGGTAKVNFSLRRRA
jgi:NitT/TauT family transport system ATP-binding protein